MVQIVGISGKKQSGKNTVANLLHGLVLKKRGMVKDFFINKEGELTVLTRNNSGEEGYGVFDVSRKDAEFVTYAEHELWPHVKLYSFADGLKNICVKFFGLAPEQVYGTDTQKNSKTDILWKDMPFVKDKRWMINAGADKYMTAREFMQYFGTNIMRQMYGPIWVNYTINTIIDEQTELAIVSDARFPNEVLAIKEAGGKVVRLTRNKFKDDHNSETALDENNYDWSNFDAVIDNSKASIETLCSKVSALKLY
jgi:hypothetical protein